jgi:urease
MKNNDYLPKIKVDPESYKVRYVPLPSSRWKLMSEFGREQVEADGVHCTVPPATKLPLTQGYMLF